MVKIKKRRIKTVLAIFMMLFASLACSSDLTAINMVAPGMSCKKSFSFFLLDMIWECTYICKAGLEIFSASRSEEFGSRTEEDMEGQCKEKYPSLYELPAPAEIDPTEEPTIEPADTETPAPPVSILTGEVTYCDPSSHVMNLRLADDFSPDEFQHTIKLDDLEIKCGINSSNQSLLSCVYPSNANFPATIQVLQNDQIVDEFQYDGSACFVTQKPEGNTDNPTLDCSPVPKPEGCDP